MKSNEWYTPAKYIEAAREVMGSIDLDPASCALAKQTVRATKYYTQEDDGLTKEWYGNVWLNPPYSHLQSPMGMKAGGHKAGPTTLWIAKLLELYALSEITQALVCINADTVRDWFQILWTYPICFCTRSILFNRPEQKPEHHFFGTCFVYLGPHEERFIRVFSQFGTIARRVEVPA